MPAENRDQHEGAPGAPTASSAPPDELLLAAVRRAALHASGQSAAGAGAPLWAIVSHLGLSRRRGPGRKLRVRLDTLVQRGWLVRGVRRGTARWVLTEAGSLALVRAHAHTPLELPESPQHRAWRGARDLAEAELPRFEEALRAQLERASGMLEAEPAPGSDAWFELAEGLRASAWLCGSAVHCLREWAEPSDERADLDDLREAADRLLPATQRARPRARRRGRRNVALWRTS